MFKEITDFVNSIQTVVTDLKYVRANDSDEITDYPAFLLENNYRKDFERQSQTGQFYLTKLRLHFYIFTLYDPDDEDGDTTFDNLADTVIRAMTDYVTLGYKWIVILNVTKRLWQIGEQKCRGVDGEIELQRTETWT